MELIQGKEYKIKYTGRFCHASKELNREDLILSPQLAIFVGQIFILEGKRNIFFNNETCTYFMFDADNVDYIIDDSKLLKKINKLENKLSKLRAML